MLQASEIEIPNACVRFVHLLVLSAVNVCVPDMHQLRKCTRQAREEIT